MVGMSNGSKSLRTQNFLVKPKQLRRLPSKPFPHSFPVFRTQDHQDKQRVFKQSRAHQEEKRG
eukprot:scaffold104508_cov14-Tisochrysis_lutea.AAC.1